MSSRAPFRPTPAWLVLLAVAATACSSQGDDSDKRGSHPAVQTVHPHYVFDVQDDQRLVGFADNVFFGRATEKVDQTNLGGSEVPTTQFRVSVSEVVKGAVGDEVTVLQGGGYSAETDELLLVDGDPLLQAGQTYLFVTTNQPNGSQLMVPKYGDLAVPNATARNALRERFEAAARHQIPFDG